jgi:hypothetical protein
MALSGVLRFRIVSVGLATTKVRDLRRTLKNVASACLALTVNSMSKKELTVGRVQLEAASMLGRVSRHWGVKIVKFHVIDMAEHTALRHMLESQVEHPDALLELA